MKRHSPKVTQVLRRFGKSVERHMDGPGMMYRTVAKDVGLTHSALWQIVNGEVVPGLDTALCLATRFGTTVDAMCAADASKERNDA